jgi:hypothetical protein
VSDILLVGTASEIMAELIEKLEKRVGVTSALN